MLFCIEFISWINIFRLCINTPQGDMMSDSILSLDKLGKEMYLYSSNLSCTYHDCIDKPQFCSLMISKRYWSWSLIFEGLLKVWLWSALIENNFKKQVDKWSSVMFLFFNESKKGSWKKNKQTRKYTKEREKNLFRFRT